MKAYYVKMACAVPNQIERQGAGLDHRGYDEERIEQLQIWKLYYQKMLEVRLFGMETDR